MSPVILAQVRALAAELGGYVGGSQAGTLDQAASVTLRVPAERFDELITRLQELTDVEVVSMSTREEDVTGQVVDLAARIRNLKASEASYRVLYDRAERIEDVLTVQGRLDEVRGQIEQLEAQLTTVEAQAALSTLTVTIIPRDEPVADAQAGWDPGAQAATAVATLVGLAQGLFNALTWVVIVILPIALVIGLIAIVVMRVLPELRTTRGAGERRRHRENRRRDEGRSVAFAGDPPRIWEQPCGEEHLGEVPGEEDERPDLRARRRRGSRVTIASTGTPMAYTINVPISIRPAAVPNCRSQPFCAR